MDEERYFTTGTCTRCGARSHYELTQPQFAEARKRPARSDTLYLKCFMCREGQQVEIPREPVFRQSPPLWWSEKRPYPNVGLPR